VGAVLPNSLYRASSQNELWEIIIHHVMTFDAVSDSMYSGGDSSSMTSYEKHWFKVTASTIVYSRAIWHVSNYGHAHFSSDTR